MKDTPTNTLPNPKPDNEASGGCPDMACSRSPETPETDEFWNRCGGNDFVWEARDFCRDMEKQRNEMQQIIYAVSVGAFQPGDAWEWLTSNPLERKGSVMSDSEIDLHPVARPWSDSEDRELIRYAEDEWQFQWPGWSWVAERFSGRSPAACRQRYNRILKTNA